MTIRIPELAVSITSIRPVTSSKYSHHLHAIHTTLHTLIKDQMTFQQLFFYNTEKEKNNGWVFIIRVTLRNQMHQLVTGVMYMSKSRAPKSFNMMLKKYSWNIKINRNIKFRTQQINYWHNLYSGKLQHQRTSRRGYYYDATMHFYIKRRFETSKNEEK